ncbi:hypothetical protein N9917_04105 [Deltaproteobacteria bacterium]|nr:hypothetical protein [Deltaproteobacteria bacterium]
MMRVWERMAGMYGGLFLNDFGDSPNQEWTDALEKVPEWRLAIALDDCLYREGDFPPKLPAFLKMCRDIPAHCNPLVARAKQLDHKKSIDPDSSVGKARAELERQGMKLGQPGYKDKFIELLKKFEGEGNE